MSGDTSSPREVYVLRDPRSCFAHYVGIAIDSKIRLHHHLMRRNAPTSAWIRELKALGLTPRMEVVDTSIPWAERHGRERQWIEAFIEADHPLVNSYLNPRYRKPPPQRAA